jgi:hypothetical protein
MIAFKIERNILILLIIILFTFININLSYAGTVVVKPGKFDHFTLQIPDKIIAGENFIIKAQIYDSNNNLITNFSESGKEFTVNINDSATIHPSALSAASFSGGNANISINSKKAEKIIFSIHESGGTVPVISRELTVLPNKLDHFVILTARTVTAGTPYDLRLTAKDLFDNTVADLDIGRNIKINSTGTTSVKIVGSSSFDFKNGSAVTSFISEKAGEVIIELQEVTSGSRGQTQKIVVNPASLSYFKLQSPKKAVAGDPFDIMIAAYDSYGNIVTNYSSVGSGVELSSTGSSKIDPSFINPSEFIDGHAVIKALYEKAEAMQVIAKERNKKQSGKTDEILVANTAPDHFVVVTPGTAVSGQKFKIKVEAYDSFNNLVKNHNIVGNDVILSTTGTGLLHPSTVPPSLFTNGIAMVNVTYDKAESFLLSAKMASVKKIGKVTLQDVKVKKEIPLKKPEKKAPPKKVVKAKVKEAPKKIVPQKAVKEKIKEEIVKKPEKTVKKEPSKKAVKDKPEEKAPEETKVPVVELAKKEEKKILKTTELFKVRKISIIEAKSKAMLVINITNPNGHLEYSDEIESKRGKEWLKLRMKPAIYKVQKSYKFRSAFVGEVILEDDPEEKNVLNIYVELLPAGVTFDIARVKNTIIVTLATP